MTSKVYVALRVPADPMRAFEAFTDEIALWWQPSSLFQVTKTFGEAYADYMNQTKRLIPHLW
jgi:hypothetical protein